MLFVTTINIPNKNLEIIAFDVQNGDAFLLKTPRNKYMIIDTGKSGYRGSSSKAKMIIIKYLRDKGIKEIDSLILTHFDNDHAGGAVDLLENVKIDKVYVNSLFDDSRIAKRIYKKTPNIICINSKTVIDKEQNFSIELNKAHVNKQKRISVDNENSIVTLVQYNKFNMLFTGDAGVVAFNQLKRQLPKNITVLKVGHHGAKNVVDKPMIDYLNPKISLISVGVNNYGHPNKKTLQVLRGTDIYRTDMNHSIKIEVTPNEYKIFTYNSDMLKYVCDKTVNYK